MTGDEGRCLTIPNTSCDTIPCRWLFQPEKHCCGYLCGQRPISEQCPLFFYSTGSKQVKASLIIQYLGLQKKEREKKIGYLQKQSQRWQVSNRLFGIWKMEEKWRKISICFEADGHIHDNIFQVKTKKVILIFFLLGGRNKKILLRKKPTFVITKISIDWIILPTHLSENVSANKLTYSIHL